MKNPEDIKKALYASRMFNLWNNPKRPNDIQEGHCEYCGRKHGENPLMVHVTTNGTCVPNDITEEELSLVGEESQGCWAIGSTCAKKMFGASISNYTSTE